MPRLTLRTLLAYIDDTLDPTETNSLGKKVADSDEARQLVDRIKKVTRRRGLAAPVGDDEDDATSDPNTVAEYLDNALDSDTLKQVEETCLESDLHLAEVAACHQILTLVLTEPVRVPPRAHRRMYELVKAPASVPNRKPSKTLPVSGAAPPAEGPVETDDADAALLFGLKRYSATTWAARFALFGAAAVLLVLLTGAVLKIVWRSDTPGPPEMVARPVGVFAPVPTPPIVPDPVAPKPKDTVPVPAMPEPRVVDPAEIVIAPLPLPPPDAKGKEPADVAPASKVREAIGRVGTQRAIVVTYRVDPAAKGPDGVVLPGTWGRLPFKPDTDNPRDLDAVFSTDPVMALPGQQASVLLGEFKRPTVEVHLWGNVPEQLAYRVFESKVIFHQPADGFDADLTLHAGRIYLKSKKLDATAKPTGAKVRVRFANTMEVWDITLSDENADALVELISWYKPRTPYAPEGGEEPRREARVAVINASGPATFLEAAGRFQRRRLDPGMQLTWDSVTNTLPEATKITSPVEVARDPLFDPKVKDSPLRKAFGDIADAVTSGTDVRPGIKSLLNVDPNAPNRDQIIRLAIYSWMALADSSAAGCETFKELLDEHNANRPWALRQAFLTSLVQWTGREKGNTALLHAYFNRPQSPVPAVQVNAILEMLRGFLTPQQPEGEQLEKLLPRLGGVTPGKFEFPDPALLLRDVAQWNLVIADRGTWIPPATGVNILIDWKKRVEEIKKRPPPKG